MSRRNLWFKSSFSGCVNNNCVEVRFVDGAVHVRHSLAAEGPVLVFNEAEWKAFELGVAHGEFKIPA